MTGLEKKRREKETQLTQKRLRGLSKRNEFHWYYRVRYPATTKEVDELRRKDLQELLEASKAEKTGIWKFMTKKGDLGRLSYVGRILRTIIERNLAKTESISLDHVGQEELRHLFRWLEASLAWAKYEFLEAMEEFCAQSAALSWRYGTSSFQNQLKWLLELSTQVMDQEALKQLHSLIWEQLNAHRQFKTMLSNTCREIQDQLKNDEITMEMLRSWTRWLFNISESWTDLQNSLKELEVFVDPSGISGISKELRSLPQKKFDAIQTEIKQHALDNDDIWLQRMEFRAIREEILGKKISIPEGDEHEGTGWANLREDLCDLLYLNMAELRTLERRLTSKLGMEVREKLRRYLISRLIKAFKAHFPSPMPSNEFSSIQSALKAYQRVWRALPELTWTLSHWEEKEKFVEKLMIRCCVCGNDRRGLPNTVFIDLCFFDLSAGRCTPEQLYFCDECYEKVFSDEMDTTQDLVKTIETYTPLRMIGSNESLVGRTLVGRMGIYLGLSCYCGSCTLVGRRMRPRSEIPRLCLLAIDDVEEVLQKALDGVKGISEEEINRLATVLVVLKEFPEAQRTFNLVKDLAEDMIFDWERVESLRDLAGVLETLGAMIQSEVANVSMELSRLAKTLSEEARRLAKIQNNETRK